MHTNQGLSLSRKLIFLPRSYDSNNDQCTKIDSLSNRRRFNDVGTFKDKIYKVNVLIVSNIVMGAAEKPLICLVENTSGRHTWEIFLPHSV